MAEGVTIVGASLAGLRLAEQLRGAGHQGPITIVGAEPHMPYNRPPLSKDVLAGGPAADASDAAALAGLVFSLRPSLADVTWLLGTPAAATDLAKRTVTLAGGRTLRYEALGIATGLTPRRLPLSGGEDSRHVVRTIDDALRLRAALTPGAHVVVAGGGFIGCETAASAVKRGCKVTIVEPLARPMLRALGPELAGAVQAFHERNGVRFRLGVALSGIETDPADARRLTGVALTDGSHLPAGVLVEAVGSHCNVDWLHGNGLDLDDGVAVDNAMRAGGRANVVAAGDVARFPNPRFDDVPRRVEHWAIPALTARRAAVSLVDHLQGRPPAGAAFDPIPSFWSDQFGVRLQSIGMPALADERSVLEGSFAAIGQPDAGGLAVGYQRAGKLVGVVTIGLPPARQGHYRNMLDAEP